MEIGPIAFAGDLKYFEIRVIYMGATQYHNKLNIEIQESCSSVKWNEREG